MITEASGQGTVAAVAPVYAYRGRPAAIRQRALACGLTTVSARALAAHTGVNRKTMDRVLSGNTVSQQTMARIVHYLGNPDDPTDALFELVSLDGDDPSREA